MPSASVSSSSKAESTRKSSRRSPSASRAARIECCGPTDAAFKFEISNLKSQMANFGAIIAGTGSCLPEKRLTNDELAKMVDTNDEWIVQRTGIRERRIAGSSETTASLGTAAARRAVEAAGLEPKDIDLVL